MKIKLPFLFIAFTLLFPVLKGTPQTMLTKGSDNRNAMTFSDSRGDTLRITMDFKHMAFWKLASLPQHQSQPEMYPEATYPGTLCTGFNRARLNWNIIDPLFYDTTGNLRPPNVDFNELSKNQVRQVLETEVFPDKNVPNGEPHRIVTFNLAYYPSERGAYNFDSEGLDGISAGLDSDGKLKEPQSRWGGMMRKIEHYQAETLMPVSLEFWLMDPFIDGLESGGDLYFNYGDISEDVMQDGKMFFEQGISDPEIPGSNASSIWGLLPLSPFPEIGNFSNSTSREIQDVGYDGMRNALETEFFNESYLQKIDQLYGDTSAAYQKALADPSADDYHYFRGSDYDDDPAYESVIKRYERFNGIEGNSPTSTQNPECYPTTASHHPDTEDLYYLDQVLNTKENYYQYKVSLDPENMVVGQSFIDKVLYATDILLPNGETTETTWYHFTIPLDEYTDAFGNVPSFDSCNFMRIFLKRFSEPVVLRFATLEMVRIKENPVYFGIDVFPNPADNRLKVVFDEFVKNKFEVSLTNMLGQVSLQKSVELGFALDFRLDVSELETGLYVLRISTSDFTMVEKVYIL